MDNLKLGQMRIPDILETIADLSNDEVFTPPQLTNKVLDMLPKEIWSNPKITFLDPATKTGVFLREITKRLIKGLETEIPDLQERVNHILTKQVYGLAITELTALMSRRTVYCDTRANSENSVCTEFNDEYGNIKFPKSKHIFNKKKKCEICGAGEDLYGDVPGLDNYAYSFLHDDLKEVFGNMKFDVIIGNPPYQLETGESSSSIPLYNKFVDKALDMNPRYISMITPSRWMMAGRGLENFREKMINDKRISNIVDYQNSQDLFPQLSVNGGISYFLWNSSYDGEVDYTYIAEDGYVDKRKRKLNNGFLETIIRDGRQIEIIKKVIGKSKKDKMFSGMVSTREPFGFETDLFNNRSKYEKVSISCENKKGYNPCYGLENNKRAVKYVRYSDIPRGLEHIDKYKIYYPLAYGTDTTLLPSIIEGKPREISTATFLLIGSFINEKEMKNCISYMKTKFFRALFQFNKYSFISSRKSFSIIPLQDWSKPWTDEELYKKYELTKDEIKYIEDNIEEML